MNIRPERGADEPEVNMTSLIDVVLILVVFFVVSTSFVREARLNVELPQAALEPGAPHAAALEVVVDARGHYFVDQREVLDQSPDGLAKAIAEVAGADRERPLTIRADAETTHQSVVTVMEVAGRLGFSHIAILTVEPRR